MTRDGALADDDKAEAAAKAEAKKRRVVCEKGVCWLPTPTKTEEEEPGTPPPYNTPPRDPEVPLTRLEQRERGYKNAAKHPQQGEIR